VRRNVFVGNDVGIWIYLGSGTTDDFGRSDDPGGNVFRCNSRSGGYGSDVLYSNSMPNDEGVVGHRRAQAGQDPDGGDPDGGTPRTVYFVGNSWDHVPPRNGELTAADGIELRSDPASPAQFDVSNAALDNTPCPAGHIP
jgi:hypothetical protein